MIPAGRTPIDQAGIAALHGLSIHQAKRRKPWADPGHPAPISKGRPRRGHPQIWDRDQAAAYANDPNGPIPDLPAEEDPNDLLDAAESAELVGIAPGTWTYYTWREEQRDQADDGVTLVPAPDATHFGTDYWRRSTVLSFKTERDQRAHIPHGGRPKGSRDGSRRGESAKRVEELLRQAKQDGEELTAAEVARRLNLHYSTVLPHVQKYRAKNGA